MSAVTWLKQRIHSLSARIFAAMLLASFVPLVVMAYQGYHCARQAVIDTESARLRLMVTSKISKIQNWFADIRSDFRLLTVIPCSRLQCDRHVLNMNPHQGAPACNLLDNLRTRSGDYLSVAVYNLNWEIVQESRAPIPQPHAPPDAFRNDLVRTMQFLISGTHIHPDGRIAIFAGSPAYEENGTIAAYIVGDLNISRAITQILNQDSREILPCNLVIYTPDRLTVAGAEPGFPVPDTRLLPNELFRAESPAMLEFDDQTGQRLLAASAKIDGLDWTAVVMVQKSHALAWLGILRNRALLTGLFTFFFAVIAAAHISRYISRPLLKLASVAGDIASGHHDKRLESFEGTEAGELAEAFNTMMDEIEATHQKLLQTASLAAVGEFSSSIAHEMRNPLSSIKINLQGLKEFAARDPLYNELAEIGLTQVDRLEKMLTGLLRYSKPLSLRYSTIAFQKLAEEVADQVAQSVPFDRLRIAIDIQPESLVFAGDMEHIRGMMINLVQNAAQAAGPDNRITIQGRITESQQVEIRVSDQGAGIPENVRRHLFQPFITTREHGTGLGLANVKKIVDYHHGTIELEMDGLPGTSFRITLPLTEPLQS